MATNQARRPGPPLAVRRGVTALVNFLTDIDDEVRRESLDAARLRLRPPLLPLVLDGLIGRLRHESPAMRQRAAESLAGLGLLAAPAVLVALVRRRDPLLRDRLGRVLTAIVPTLERDHRLQLAQTLEGVIAGDRSGALASACATAIAALHREEATEDIPPGTRPAAPVVRPEGPVASTGL